MKRFVRSPAPAFIPTTMMRVNEYGYQIDSETGELVHRVIYWEKHGKTPRDSEIHHIDGNKLNNDIENLIAIPRKFHVYIHRKYGFKDLPDRNLLKIEIAHWAQLIDEYKKLQVRLNAVEAALYGNLGRVKRIKSKHQKQKRIHPFPGRRYNK